jgi:hypothetical protein
MPQPPRRVELEAASILLGVDHEHPTGADHQVVKVGPAARDSQVVQDSPAVPLQRSQQAGGTSLPRRSPPPGDGLWAGLEPHHPAGCHGRERAEDQSKPGRHQAAENSAGGPHPKDGGHPPGQAAGPGRPLARPFLPPPRLGRAAWPANAGPHPQRYHRPISTGIGQQLVGVVAEVGQDGLQVGLAERPHRAAGPVIVVERRWWRTGHRYSFLPVLAGGPLRASSARLLVRSWLAGALAGRLGIVGAVGGPLLGVDPLDSPTGSLPIGPLSRVARLGAERPVRIGDLVAAPVVLDLGRGLPPGPPAPSRLRHRPQPLKGIAGAVGLDRHAGGAALPGQGPHHLPILRAELRVRFQPAVAALLVLAQLPLPIIGPVGLLGSHRRQPTRHPGGQLLAATQPAKHAGRLAAGGRLMGGYDLLGLLAVDGGPGQLSAAVAGGLVELAAQPIPLGPQLGRGQPYEIRAAGGVDGQLCPPARDSA